jgi:hypothetical protein
MHNGPSCISPGIPNTAIPAILNMLYRIEAMKNDAMIRLMPELYLRRADYSIAIK